MDMDIIKLLNDYNIEYSFKTHHNTKGWVNINCPICDDHKFHGGINLSKNYYNCWRCGGYNLEYIFSKILNKPIYKIKKILYDYEGSTLLNNKLNKKTEKSIDKIVLPGSDLKSIHKKYLIKRNFDPDYIIKKYKIKGTLMIPKEYQYRIIIPIFNQNNNLITFQTRDTTNKQIPKYKNLSKEKSLMDIKNTFYGLNFIKNQDKIIIVEGVLDQWKLGEGSIASFGTILTDYQIKILSNFKQIFFLWDFEKKAYKQAFKYAKKLSLIGNKTEIINLGSGIKDPAELKNKEALYIKKQILN